MLRIWEGNSSLSESFLPCTFSTRPGFPDVPLCHVSAPWQGRRFDFHSCPVGSSDKLQVFTWELVAQNSSPLPTAGTDLGEATGPSKWSMKGPPRQGSGLRQHWGGGMAALWMFLGLSTAVLVPPGVGGGGGESGWRQGEEEEAQGKRAGEQKAAVYLSSTHVQREVNKAQKWLSSPEITKKAGAGPALPACSAWDQQSLQQ